MPDFNPPNFGRFLEEGLKIIANCPVCHFRYDSAETRIIDENDGAHLVYLKCQRCQSATLVLLMANNFGVSSIGVLTDLDSHEVLKFKDLPEVNSDDVLSVYHFLQNSSSASIF